MSLKRPVHIGVGTEVRPVQAEQMWVLLPMCMDIRPLQMSERDVYEAGFHVVEMGDPQATCEDCLRKEKEVKAQAEAFVKMLRGAHG